MWRISDIWRILDFLLYTLIKNDKNAKNPLQVSISVPSRHKPFGTQSSHRLMYWVLQIICMMLQSTLQTIKTSVKMEPINLFPTED